MRSIARTLGTLALCAELMGCGSSLPTVEVSRPEKPVGLIVIQNVSVFDADSLEVSSGMDVVMRDGEIVGVLPTGKLPETMGALIISGEGATLVPGLIDMHGHVNTATGPSWQFALPDPEANLRAYVYAGVTTVFDPSDASGEAFSRRERVASGELIGPRIYSTGMSITCSGGHPRALIQMLAPSWISWYLVPRAASTVDTEAEAFEEVNRLADAGADAIKIVIDAIPLDAQRMPRKIAAAIAAQAKFRGLRTVAHIGTTEDAIDAAEAGVALWVHGVYKERIPDDKIAVLAGYGIPMVTTSEVFDRWGRSRRGPIDPTRLERETVAREVFDAFANPPEDFDVGGFTSWLDLVASTRDVRLDNVRRMHEAGVTILAGSDVQSGVFPGASLHRELAILVDAGFTPAEAIRAATLDPARFLANGGEPDSGIIKVGKRADLLLVNGDPTRDISALADIREVFLQGVPIHRTAVTAATP
jgi:imidazolonepropionase-like amidohydrolase